MPDASRLDFQSAIDTLALKHQMKGRDLEFFLQKDGENAYISMFASHDTTIKKKLGKTKSNVKRKRGRRGVAVMMIQITLLIILPGNAALIMKQVTISVNFFTACIFCAAQCYSPAAGYTLRISAGRNRFFYISVCADHRFDAALG